MDSKFFQTTRYIEVDGEHCAICDLPINGFLYKGFSTRRDVEMAIDFAAKILDVALSDLSRGLEAAKLMILNDLKRKKRRKKK